MPKWKFTIKQKGGYKVQGVGLRPAIISILIDGGFERGDAVNSNNENEVFVYVEGTEKKVKELKGEIESQIKTEAKQEYSDLPKDFEIGEPERIENPPAIYLPLLSTKANSMLLSQTAKGVGVMVNGFKGLESKFENGFKGLESKFENGFKGLESKFENGFNGLETKFENGFKGLETKFEKLANALLDLSDAKYQPKTKV